MATTMTIVNPAFRSKDFTSIIPATAPTKHPPVKMICILVPASCILDLRLPISTQRDPAKESSVHARESFHPLETERSPPSFSGLVSFGCILARL
jgi:hypothetical protein